MAKISRSQATLREAGSTLSGLFQPDDHATLQSPGFEKSTALLLIVTLIEEIAQESFPALKGKTFAIRGRAEFPGGHLDEELLEDLSECLSGALSLLVAGNSTVECVISDRLDFRLRQFGTPQEARNWLKEPPVHNKVAPSSETPYVRVVDKEVQHPITKPDPQTLTKLFQQLTAADLSQLPVELLDEHEQQLKEARLLQAKAMIGVNRDQKITLFKVNQFLKRHANQSFDNQSSVLLSRLISNLRSTEHRKLIFDNGGQPVECVLTSVFRKDRGTRSFQLFGVGGPQKSYWYQAALPPGLHLE
ncbi:hypothetical protein [Planctomicrobium sp. SH664]|uniref:hypothetical protein n=1 Tax=Planctomicrobium sp. SH664 TaxID=3448125 RepID=UPI003F5BA325